MLANARKAPNCVTLLTGAGDRFAACSRKSPFRVSCLVSKGFRDNCGLMQTSRDYSTRPRLQDLLKSLHFAGKLLAAVDRCAYLVASGNGLHPSSVTESPTHDFTRHKTFLHFVPRLICAIIHRLGIDGSCSQSFSTCHSVAIARAKHAKFRSFSSEQSD